MGAAQLVTISEAKEFVRKLNAYLNEAVLSGAAFSGWPRTQDRMRPGAGQGRQWLAIEGHCLRFSFPAHPGEWARGKAEWIKSLMEEWAKHSQPGGPTDYSPAFFLQVLALFPSTIQESSEEIVLRLGEPSRPSTFRFSIRDEYKPNLEEVLAENLKPDLDEDLAAALLSGAPAAGTSPLDAVRTWGPPEEKVRALLAAARKSDAGTRKTALERLNALGAEIAKDALLPNPPMPSADPEAAQRDWKDWYRRALHQLE